MHAVAEPPELHVVMAVEVDEQHFVSQLPLLHVPSLLQLPPFPILG